MFLPNNEWKTPLFHGKYVKSEVRQSCFLPDSCYTPDVKHGSLENRSTKGNVPSGVEQLGKTKTCGELLKKNLKKIKPTLAARTNTQLRASTPHMGIGLGAVTAHKSQHLSWDNSELSSSTITYQFHFTVHAICWLGCLPGQLGSYKHSKSKAQKMPWFSVTAESTVVLGLCQIHLLDIPTTLLQTQLETPQQKAVAHREKWNL